MQVARNTFSPRATGTRVLAGNFSNCVARLLEQSLTKDQSEYLNAIYLGNGVYGVKERRATCSASVCATTVAEGAMLAALQGTVGLTPRRNPPGSCPPQPVLALMPKRAGLSATAFERGGFRFRARRRGRRRNRESYALDRYEDSSIRCCVLAVSLAPKWWCTLRSMRSRNASLN
jgi:hypothetical protein